MTKQRKKMGNGQSTLSDINECFTSLTRDESFDRIIYLLTVQRIINRIFAGLECEMEEKHGEYN